MQIKDQSLLHLPLRNAIQRRSRNNYIKYLPNHIAPYVHSFDFYISPNREVIIMDLLEKYATRNILEREFNRKTDVYNFIKAFKRVPPNLDVYVWGVLEQGPVYKINLKWFLNNFEVLWNSYNRFNLSVISENGKVGIMVNEIIKAASDTSNFDDVTYQVKKWGLM